MKSFFKPKVFVALSAVAVLAVSGCSEKTPEQLILGDWKQVEAVTIDESGTSVTIKDTTLSYLKDGSSKGTMSMSLAGLPDDLANYDITTTGTWKIEDGILIETLTDASVSNPANSPQGNEIAGQMEAGMKGQPEGRSEIKELTKSSLVVYQKETDLSLSFTR